MNLILTQFRSPTFSGADKEKLFLLFDRVSFTAVLMNSHTTAHGWTTWQIPSGFRRKDFKRKNTDDALLSLFPIIKRNDQSQGLHSFRRVLKSREEDVLEAEQIFHFEVFVRSPCAGQIRRSSASIRILAFRDLKNKIAEVKGWLCHMSQRVGRTPTGCVFGAERVAARPDSWSPMRSCSN